MKKKIQFLEWVRGIAAIMVAAQHYFADAIPAFDDFTRKYIDFGRVGVVAFFLVSGYVISLSLRQGDVRSFIIKRLFRLYPVYIVILTLVLIYKHQNADWGDFKWSLEVFANYTMLQELVGFSAIVGAAWTLSIEWVFYAQQVLAKVANVLDKAWRLGYFWLTIFLLSNVAERLMGRDLPGSLAMLLSVSCLGQAIYLAHNDQIKMSSLRFLASTTCLVVPISSYIGMDKAGQWPPLVYSLSFLGGLAFFAAAFSLRMMPGGHVLPWLGSISYSMYLLPSIVMRFIHDLVDGAMWPGLLLGIVFLPLTAWLAYRYIETPFNRLGHRLAKRKRSGPALIPVQQTTM